jgi:tRNA(Ile)-lysidine synthase
MLSEFEKKVAGFIEANDCFGSADKILLAVSGGADSTALLHAMCSLKAAGVLSAELLCAHINHQLRGAEADGDEDFVVAQARQMGLTATTRRVDVRSFAHKNRLSIETAARKLRIESLLDIAKAGDCRWIATAHQKNDNAETVLQRLARGTGFRGLGGICPVRSFAGGIYFARPFLCVSRNEIIEYLKKRDLEWRTDHTNADWTYRRNFIRHRLIPALQQDCSGSIVEQLFVLSQSAQRFYSLVGKRADKIWAQLSDCKDENVMLDLKLFQSVPKPVRVELVRRSLAHLGSGERDLTHRHYERILQLSKQNISGRVIELPHSFAVCREYGKLIFSRASKTLRPDEQIIKSIELEIPEKISFGNYLIEASVLDADKCDIEKFKAEKTSFIEWFDFDKMSLPLVARFRKAADRFWPLGLAAEKKVGKFLTAAKVSQQVRRKVLIIADRERIIWVFPIRISEDVKVTGRTQKILQMQITETGPSKTGKVDSK